jgi:hypothetical protein
MRPHRHGNSGDPGGIERHKRAICQLMTASG